MIRLLCLLLHTVTIAASTTAQQETKQWTLLHSFNGRDFSQRGTVLLEVSDGTAAISLTNDEHSMDVAQIEAMMSSGLYQLKLQNEDTSVLTTVPSCQLRQASFRDELTVTLNTKGSAISLSYAPLVSPLALPCDTMELPKEPPSFTSKIILETAVPGMAIPLILPPTTPQQGLKFFPKASGLPGQPALMNGEQKSFFARYWYMILPFAIMSLMGGEQPPPPQAAAQAGTSTSNGAPPSPRQPAMAAAAATDTGSSPTKQRRGKRS